MNDPANPIRALIPRNPLPWPNDRWDREDEPEEFRSYAPAGSAWRARVRRLADVDDLPPVAPVGDGDEGTGSGGDVRVHQLGPTTRIRIRAEIELEEGIPEQGCVIETQTFIRPGSPATTRVKR